MTINQAIEYLEIMLRNYDPACPFDEVDALKLGIEALKRIRNSRIGYDPSGGHKLPGETEES